MYPNLYYLFKDFFGVNWAFLKIINSFGFFVALSFLAAAWLFIKELKRKQALGIFTYTETTITVGEPAGMGELLVNFALGFLLGYKIIGVLFMPHALDDPQSFIFSGDGSFFTGLALGLLLAGLKWWEKNKVKLAKPEQRKIRIWPSDRVGDVTIIAAVAGFAGAKIFDNLENWDRFIKDPIGNLFSPMGLTFYGGLIVATLALWYYFKKKNISFINICDAAAPALILAYGLGRIGCQVAGDGDWGIINSAYITANNGKVIPGTPQQVDSLINIYGEMYRETGMTGPVQKTPVKAFAGLPDWMFAYSYPHNVNKTGIATTNCTFDDYCNHLPLPVFPTPLYEIIMALGITGILWGLRKKITVAGRMFAVYLILNGIERFLIEQIRVNTRYSFLGIHPTQAEIISLSLILAGALLYWYAPKIKTAIPARPANGERIDE
ncbi:MAG TPA: prolipoprotein diacylglyceryl transferase family protein [Chitinophagaceae bacterium]|nr:prolipoprotein diacylglyceryl transferase family protein [Chitinophagaceae bacterium]